MGVYLGVAAVAVVGLVRTMRSQARSRAYLELALQEEAPALDHLGPALVGLVADARAIRTSLDAPERILAQAGPLGALGGDAEELDSLLRELSRELGDWIGAVERLGEADRTRLEELSAQPRQLERLFREENYAIERHRGRGRRTAAQTLAQVRALFEAFERELQRARDPYR